MEFLTAHRAHVGEESRALIARIESVFGVVRKPLGSRLRAHREFLSESILAKPAEALALYRLDPTFAADEATRIAEEVRDELMAVLDRFLRAVDAGDVQGLRALGDALTTRMELGIGLWAAQPRLSDLRTILAADSAFHLYRYLLEILERCLDALGPRSALDLRRSC